MRSFFSLFALLFLLLLFKVHGATASNKLIRDTCKQISEGDSKVNYDFCKNELGEAWDEDFYPSLETLGSVTLKLVTKKLTDTKSYIEDLKNDDPEPNLNACLSDCLELYSNTIGDLEDAEEDYQSRKYREASEETDEVLTSLTNCEDGFKEKGLRSPLTERSNHAFQLSAIAINILRMLG